MSLFKNPEYWSTGVMELPSPAYRQAGFAKGRNSPSLVKRGEGRFYDNMSSQFSTPQ